ncbi:hypothetical protein ACFV24_01405 [Nocardia fluminea]|uniref:hypothetical protein n=1 Tax=Nocardia fluminea TaxID=134984 RepID=UPI00366C92F9
MPDNIFRSLRLGVQTFTIDSDTQITAISPTGAGTVDVTVEVELNGTSNALPLTYV